MSTYKNPPGFENVVTCPYNPCHQILPHRMQIHLIKCAKQHKHIHLEVCPFNQTHHLKKEDIGAHKLVCPDRAAYDRYLNLTEIDHKMKEKNDARLNEISQQIKKNPFVQSEDNWDHFDVPTYNARKVASEKNVMLTLSVNGLTPAQRRDFRKSEAQRLNKMDAEQKPSH